MALVNRNKTTPQRHLIPTSLTHSAGTITAVINGVSYSVNLTGLTANTLYFLYLRINSGTAQLFFVTTVPSTYRVSFPEAILVGAFYSNGLTSVAFGSFINIEGIPSTTNDIAFNAVTQGFGTISSEVSNWSRTGLNLFINTKFTAGTVTATQARFNFPGAITASPLTPVLGAAGNHINSNASTTDGMAVLKEPNVGYFTFSRQSSGAFNAANGSAIFNNGEAQSFFAIVAIQQWSNTPLKDL